MSSCQISVISDPNSTNAQVSLLDAPNARVKEFSQAAGSAGQWHYHSAAWEHCYALDGPLWVEFDDAPMQALNAGQRCAIAPLRRHRVVNLSAQAVRYLVIQGPGAYDYQPISTKPSPAETGSPTSP